MADGALVANVVQCGIIQSRDSGQSTINSFFIAGKMDEAISTLSIDVLRRAEIASILEVRSEVELRVSYLIDVRLLDGTVQNGSILFKQLAKRIFAD